MNFKKTILFLVFLGCSINSSDVADNIRTNNIQDAIEPYCNGVNFESLQNLSYEDLESLNLNISPSSEWYKNLISAYYDGDFYPNGFIKNQYKKTFPTEVFVNYKNFSCIINAEVRISGDWKDHIDINKVISSLDVSLKNGNVFGITKFKLFLPNTRIGDNEIFTTTMFSNLGFISPRTFYTDVTINNFDTSNYIFQEKTTKELVEFNQYREGPILEINEKFHWETTTGVPFKEVGEILINSKITNLNWSRKNTTNQFISLAALEKLNSSIFFSSNKNLNYSKISSNSSKLHSFDVIAYSLNADHSLINHNRKFFYNRIDDEIIPIYYDGNSNILDSDIKLNNNSNKYSQELSIAAKEIYDYLNYSNFNIEDFYSVLKSKGVNRPIESVESAYNKFIDNLLFFIDLNSAKSNKQIETRKSPNYKYFTKVEDSFIFYDVVENLYTKCDSHVEGCVIIQNEKNENIFLKTNKNLENSSILGFNKNLSSDYKSLKEFPNNNIKIYYSGDPKINVNTKEVVIEILNIGDNVLIAESNLTGYKVFINGNDNLAPYADSRYNENLLTGCITFKDVFFSETYLSAINLGCEDSINIMNSRGDIKEVYINDSKVDALDIDFSDLYIEKLQIKNSENDCLDLSNSNVNIFYVEVLNCIDKGLSVGEKSNVYFEKFNVSNSTIGVAVKDSSFLNIKIYNGTNLDFCTQIYRKKQEFGPSKFLLEKNQCVSKFSNVIQEGSIFEERK